MDKEMKLEKQDLMKIINEIDITLFGVPQKLKFNKLKAINFLEGSLGALSGGVVATFFDDKRLQLASVGIGYAIGVIISYYLQNNETHYSFYEFAYLNLSRQDQLKVLELSKKLFEQYKSDLKFDKNKKYVENYLNLDSETTMFDYFESNHPHFEIMSQEEIEQIHQRGKLTPVEKYNEWERLGHCPGSGDAWRCKKYGNCRDCLVSWASEKNEWSPIEFKPINLFEQQIDQENYKQKTKQLVNKDK